MLLSDDFQKMLYYRIVHIQCEQYESRKVYNIDTISLIQTQVSSIPVICIFATEVHHIIVQIYYLSEIDNIHKLYFSF